MNKPKRQHFIPQSYLKNFAKETDGKFFVEAKRKDEENPKGDLISIKDICIDKNIYTIPDVEDDKKYALETFYATHIDAVYPEIYDILTNPNITYITPKQRGQIILTTMSLFFRTPKFLNHNERKTDIILDYVIQNFKDLNGNIKRTFRGFDFDFHIDNKDQIRTKLKIQNKRKFISEHLKQLQDFVEFKIAAGITVFKICDEIQLITSDNPVTMRSVKGNKFDVFDPTNIISLPLDDKHYLVIYPNTEKVLTDRIFKGEVERAFALGVNFSVEENCEEWIMGKPLSVHNHILDQFKYGYTDAGHQLFEDMKEKAFDAQELSRITEKYGYYSNETAMKIKELKKKEIHQRDPEMQKVATDLAMNGFN